MNKIKYIILIIITCFFLGIFIFPFKTFSAETTCGPCVGGVMTCETFIPEDEGGGPGGCVSIKDKACGGTTPTTKDDDREPGWHCNPPAESCYYAKKQSHGYDTQEQCEAQCIYCRYCKIKNSFLWWSWGGYGCYGIKKCSNNIDECTNNAQCSGETTPPPTTYNWKECVSGKCTSKSSQSPPAQGTITCSTDVECQTGTISCPGDSNCYKCNTSYQCVKSSTGKYKSKTSCLNNCKEPTTTPTSPPSTSPPPPPQYSCKQCRGTTCSVRYSSTPCSNTCTTDADCRVPTPPSNGVTPPSNGWTPPSNGVTPPSNGWTPPVSPPPPPKYSCNKSTWTCYQNPSGPYSSLSSCQSACVEPPCMINYFEFPKRAWVGYSITGRWSASDWCVDCDVTCTPYPECAWKQDNIGTGFDEHKFTLEQSGNYIYTLTCYKQGGRDQKQVTVSLEALNLPWWREIIPVLPGFLRGIWK